MDPTASIRRLGFRKWYERELIKSHAALVTCFLSGLLCAALIEPITAARFSWTALGLVAVIFVAIVVGCLSWHSYITVLQRAERYGERSTCPKCNAYGRFDVVETGMDTHPSAAAEAVAPLQSAWLKVECRQCGTGWRMPE